MTFIEKMWFKPTVGQRIGSYLLAPLALLFWLVSALRKWLYKHQLLTSEHPGVPVVIVGNLTVGGNGKTPLVVHIARMLQQRGLKPGVLSRGYGATIKDFPRTVTLTSLASEVGDEPVLMRHNLTCPLVIDPVRIRGAKVLVSTHQCNVIICDDGLQHYPLQRDIEIVVVDSVRRFGNGHLLPMGPLRERTTRLENVDFVVANGTAIDNREVSMTLQPGKAINLRQPHLSKALNEFSQPVSAIAAIGNPDRFFDLLRSHQVKLAKTIALIDHHPFSAQDIPQGTVLMTEKDAVKCKQFAHSDCWYLPVEAKLNEQFDSELHNMIQHNLKEH